MATFDITAQVKQGRPQSMRRVELPYRINFATLGDGTGLAQNETALFAYLPPGYVHERLDAVLRTAEGAATTLDVGTAASPTLFANALDMNGTPNAKIQPETVSSANGTDLATTQTLANEIKADLNRLLAAGATYFHTKTGIEIRNPGATLLDGAMVDLTFVGYMVDTGNER